MEITAKVVEHSVAPDGVELITIDAYYPRFALAEMNTHRVFSRNGASSRAIPFHKMLAAIRAEPAQPLQWLLNEPGMVATGIMEGDDAAECQEIWLEAMEDAIRHAQRLADKNASKQYVNRIVEPFMMTRTLITSSKWANFFALRDHPAAMPEFGHLAKKIKDAIDASIPVKRNPLANQDIDRWHLPYFDRGEFAEDQLIGFLKQVPDEVIEGFDGVPWFDATMIPIFIMTIARCARLSYNLFDGKPSTFETDLNTFSKLWSNPLHASPMEHQAIPIGFRALNRTPALAVKNDYHAYEIKSFGVETGNFHGWRQLRKYLPHEQVVDEAAVATA